MPISKADLEKVLEENFLDAEINVIDLAGDNDHWEVRIASDVFTGKNLIQQHKMVQNLFKDHDIHALSIKTSNNVDRKN